MIVLKKPLSVLHCLFHPKISVVIAFGILAAVTGRAGTIVWSGASGTDTNWSNGNNWAGSVAPGNADDVKFFDAGGNTVPGVPNSLVDLSFGGTIGSLAFGNTNNQHTVSIASGATLIITNTGGLSDGTPTDPAVAKNFTNSVVGPGGTLMVSNTAANISVNQATAASGTDRANFDLSGLDTFVVNANRIGIGDGQFPGVPVNNHVGGNLVLARTNYITLAYSDTLANYQLAGKNSAIILARNSGNNPGIIALLQLGISNVFNVDSMDFGMDKSGNNSTPAHGVMRFNPLFSGLNPVAYFYGLTGPGSRMTWWSIGDGNQSGSSSNGGGGTNDFSQGTLYAYVNVMSLARDAATVDTWAGPHKGVLIYTNGVVDVNTLYVGNQTLETGASTTASLGIMTLNGAGATLKVNSAMTLGVASLATAAGTKTFGVLNVTNGTALINSMAVGANSVSNMVNLVNATMIVSNTFATNASGLFFMNVTNSTIGLTLTANGNLKGLVQTFNTTGPTNHIQLDPTPVIFPVYPSQVSLIKYTTWTGSNTFGLASVPAWLPGATLVSNGPNKSLDLSIPTDPRPVFTAQPSPYAGSPGDSVTTNFSVIIAAGSVTPLGYQWYYVSGGVTNLLADGPGPSGSSTLSGSMTANLQIANAQPADSGNYFAVATNAYGTNSSSLASLTISAGAIAPSVTGPAALTVTNGVTGVIADTASGSPVPVLYWQYNGALLADGTGPSGSSTISGSATASLTIANPQLGDQGTYSLIASNSAGLATNNTVLTVIVPPQITSQPVSLVVTNTQAAAFTVAATGIPSPAFQWYKNGFQIGGATSATLSIGSAGPGDIANYYCVITNQAGTTNTVTVSLTVNSVMAPTAFSPANGQSGVCYDTPLYVTFNTPPVERSSGTIKIYNVTNSSTPVDTINLALNVNGIQGHSAFPGDGQGFNYFPVIIKGSTAAIYPHSAVMTSNQTYYVLISDGAFADTNGAYFAGISATNVWQFSTKVGGPMDPNNLVVAQDYSGDFATVQGAIDSVTAGNTTPRTVSVKNGNYVEIVDISGKHDILVRGQSRAGTIVGYPNNANVAPGGTTHARMAFKVSANDISLDNLTVTNMTPQGGGQAEALMIESGAARCLINNCSIYSLQDTILANQSSSKAYFNQSLIVGNVDFIWGGGNLFFTNCEIRYVSAGSEGPNPSPSSTDINSNGFSFINCQFTSLPGASNSVVGRTRSITNGNTALITCFVTTNINGWASDASPVTAYRNWYYNCTNDLGNQVTLNNGIALASNDPNLALASSATQWLYGWVPALSPNITTQPVGVTLGAGQSATFTAAATGLPAPTYQWLDNGVPISGATGSSYTIASAVRTNAGNYAVVVNNGSGTVTSSVAALTYTNTPPAASPFTMGALLNIPNTVPVVGAYTSDADGDSLTASIQTGPVNGTATTDGINVTYTGTNGIADSFTYSVSDGFGGSASATITVVVNTNTAAYNQLGVGSANGGTNVFSFLGNPGSNYALEAATNLVPPVVWVPQFTNPAPQNGVMTFTNVSSGPQSFFRTRLAQ